MQDWCSWSVVLGNTAWTQVTPVCSQWWGEEDNQATISHGDSPVTASFFVWAYCMHGWWRRSQDDPNGSPTWELEETVHQGAPLTSRGFWTPFSEIWELPTSHWMKQSTGLRSVLYGGWCLHTALTSRGEYQKRLKEFAPVVLGFNYEAYNATSYKFHNSATSLTHNAPTYQT